MAEGALPGARPPPRIPLETFKNLVFDNAFATNLPWTVESESVFGANGFALLIVRQGDELGAVMLRDVGQDPVRTLVIGTQELGVPCDGCVVENLCQVNGVQDMWLVGIVHEADRCGGWGKTHPKKAWRGDRRGNFREVPPLSVTCGTMSCEGP